MYGNTSKLNGHSFFALFVIAAMAFVSCGRKNDGPTPAAAPVKADHFKVSDSNRWLAVVGDSGVTGAVASPRLQPSLDQLGKFIFDDSQSDARKEDIPSPEKYNITEDRPAPLTRVLYSFEERRGIEKERAQATERAAQKLDIGQYSWAYLSARKLGVKPADILMVAQDGARVDSLATQFQRIKDSNSAQMPPLVLVSFNANDLCDDAVLAEPADKLVAKYEATIREQMGKGLANAKSHGKQTKIILFAPLDVMQVMTNPELLAQKVNFQGKGEIECRNLRQGDVTGTLTQEMRQRLLGMCKSVLDTKLDEAPRIQKLSELSAAYVTAWERLAKEFNAAYSAQGFVFEFSDVTRKTQFQNGDLANECFHPGVKAHAKIADQVLQFLEQIKFQL